MTNGTGVQQSTLQPRAQIIVVLGASDLTLRPGEPAAIAVMLTNGGDSAEEVTLSVEGAPESWVQGHGWPVEVLPGGQAETSLFVTAAHAADTRAGLYPVNIQASSSDGQPLGSTRAVWTVESVEASSLKIQPAAASGTSGASYKVTLRNEGNATAWYTLNSHMDGFGLHAQLTPSQVALDNNESADILLTVRGQRRWTGGPVTHSIRVRAIPSSTPGEFGHSSSEAARVETVQFTHRALVPAWLLQLAVVLLLVAGTGAGVLWYMAQDTAGLVEARRLAARDGEIARIDAERATHQAAAAKQAYQQAAQVATQADHTRSLAEKAAVAADADRDAARRDGDLADFDRLSDAANVNIADRDRDAAARAADIADRARDDTRQAADSCDRFRNDADKAAKLSSAKAAQAREAADKARLQMEAVQQSQDRAAARGLADKITAFATEAADDEKQTEEQASQAKAAADGASQASKDAFNHYKDVKTAANAASAAAKSTKAAYRAAENNRIAAEKATASRAAALEQQAQRLQQQEQALSTRQPVQLVQPVPQQ